jgi:hypothetical protein
MNSYQYYREPCALCGEEFAKRDLNKLMFSVAHISVPNWKKLCGVCDNCLPNLMKFLEVEPRRTDRDL